MLVSMGRMGATSEGTAGNCGKYQGRIERMAVVGCSNG